MKKETLIIEWRHKETAKISHSKPIEKERAQELVIIANKHFTLADHAIKE